MDRPVRLRLSRARGFDLQAHSRATNGLDAENVARPSAFGNPFVVGRDGTREGCVKFFGMMLDGYFCLTASPPVAELRETRAAIAARLEDLRGKNLACWCALDGKPCHADILLELANQ